MHLRAFSEPSTSEYWQPWDTHPVAVSGGSVIRFHGLWRLAIWIDRVQAPILTLMYCVTLGFAVLGFFLIMSSYDSAAIIRIAPVVALAVGTLGTMAAYCLLAGYDPRYSAPHLGTIVLCNSLTIALALGALERRSISTGTAAHIPVGC